MAVFALVLLSPLGANGQAPPEASANATAGRIADTAQFLLGAGAGFLIHESGHLLFNGIFDGDPGLKKVSLAGIPFFAITHRDNLSPRREYAVSSAGFWMQHLTSEWILTARPSLQHERGWPLKGMLAFNVGASVGYSVVAFARAGPAERDTRSMAESRGISERWIGVLVLAPAVLDAWRYFKPDASWARWSSRAAKVGMVLLIVKGS